MNNINNQELIQITNNIKQLYNDISNHKKILIYKMNKLEHYKKKKNSILNENNPVQAELISKTPFPIINEQIPICNNKISVQKKFNAHIPTKPKLLIKIGSRHENNYS